VFSSTRIAISVVPSHAEGDAGVGPVARIPAAQHRNVVHVAKTIHLSSDFTSFIRVAR